MSPRQIVARGFLLGVFAALLGAGAFFGYVAWYTGTDRILPGVTIGQTPVGGLARGEASQRLTAPGDAIWRPPVLAGGPGAAGGNPVGGTGGAGPQLAPQRMVPEVARLQWNGRTWELPLRDVGAVPNVNEAVRSAADVGRQGPLWHRARTFLDVLLHGYQVPLEPGLKEEQLRNRLERIASEVNQPAADARYDFETDTVTEEVSGQELDLQESLALVKQAVLNGQNEVKLTVKPVKPSVSTQDLHNARQHQIARFTTKIFAADPGRVHNIQLAAKKISGVVLQPGQVFSFNNIVGPRDQEHGWAQANELYQGEFVMGYGGGICQVSSTLYNSVLLGGLEVRERYHHDRPLQYIDPGRDATVAWEVLDFKFRNSLDMPVMIAARLLPGQPQEVEVSLFAPRPAADGRIRLEEAEVRYFPPPLEEVLDSTLAADERKVVDEGHYGIEVKIFRVFREHGKERRELVSHDRYEPKPGKVRVGVGNAPGADRLLKPGLQ